MDIIKAQKDVFAALVSGQCVHRFAVDDTHTFVTPDGYHGWVFPNALIAFNLEKIPEFKPLQIKGLIKKENALRLTYEFRYASFRDKRLLRKLSNTYDVYVQEKFLRYFQNPSFYQEKGKKEGQIIVTETFKRDAGPEPVGIVLPVRIATF